MSVPVSLDRLRDEMDQFGTTPYLLTVSDDDRPHCVAVTVAWEADELVTGAGSRTLANAATRPGVSLLWPAADAGGYSLIVDATVTATRGTGQDDSSITMRPTHAVLHRPAARDASDAAGCGSDCVPVLRT